MSGADLPPDDVDTGEPIAELGEMSYDVSSGFAGRVRRSLERRSLSTGFLSLVWYLPVAVFMEFLTVVFGTVKGGSTNDEGGGS